MISAVDLLKGIAKINGMKVIEVEGATGNYDTNFTGKAQACVNALKNGLDFVYVHMEAPDECGHHGDAKNKIYSIEKIDEVVSSVVNGLKELGEDYKILICPDHPTPLNIKTHASDPIPFVIYDSRNIYSCKESAYTEKCAENTGITVESGEELMKIFLEK
jgi:2,3-bisphosphoglycerate-independent phosphoglycerate mutase